MGFKYYWYVKSIYSCGVKFSRFLQMKFVKFSLAKHGIKWKKSGLRGKEWVESWCEV